MDERKELILDIIIKEHIKTGAPVGSGVVAEKYHLEVSPATVRNEMSWLEHEGWIVQPHTSAGRVPTEAAYHWFAARIRAPKARGAERSEIQTALGQKGEDRFKQAAKALSVLSGNAVFWAINRRNLYYTGISRLFAQPEFAQIEKVYDISAVIDRMDEVIESVFDNFDVGTHTLIGNDNPFGNFFSAIIAKYRLKGETGMFGVIGPLRMDYEKNAGLVEMAAGELK